MNTRNAFSIKKLILWGGDVLLIVISFYLARVLRFGSPQSLFSIFWPFEITALFFYLLFFYIFDLHNIKIRRDSSTFVHMGLAIAIVNIPLTSLFYFFNVRPYGAGLFFFSACLIYIFTYGWRFIFDRVFPPDLPTRIVILGADVAGQFVQSSLADNSVYQLVGFLDDDPNKKGLKIAESEVIGNMEMLGSLVSNRSVDTAVLAVPHSVKPETYRNLYEIKMTGIDVYDLPSFCEMALGKIPIYHVNDSWLISEPILGVRPTIYNVKSKILIDKVFSIIALIIISPLLLLIALAIKIDSAGPVIYRQQRVGKGGCLFNLYKFRSMQHNAEVNGAVWASQNDPRITRVGAILRRLRFDEIPQFWNVLKGEMGLVGPRPERPEFIKDLTEEIPYFSLRQSVLPGITGWAQVNYPYGASKEDAIEKLQYDIYYIKNLSPLLDFVILARTLRIVFFGLGAR